VHRDNPDPTRTQDPCAGFIGRPSRRWTILREPAHFGSMPNLPNLPAAPALQSSIENQQSSITIDYTYDPLRLTSALTPMARPSTTPTPRATSCICIHGQRSTTRQLRLRCRQPTPAPHRNSVVWHYTYDGQWQPDQSTPGDSLFDGAKRYTTAWPVR